MKYLKRDAVAARIVDAAGKELGGFALRSMAPTWERRAIGEDDITRVKDTLGEDAAKGRIVPFVISTARRADDQMVLPPAGCSLERFSKNPRVFWQHMTWSRSRVGDAVAWIEPDAVRALVSFLSRDLSDALDDGFAWALGELAFLRGHACSVGFDVLSAVAAPDEVRKQMPWAIDVVAWVLLELSMANVPADEDAISEGRASGLDVSPLVEGFSKLLDTLEGSGIDRARIESAWSAAAAGRSRVFDLAPAPAQAESIDAAAVRAALRAAFTRP